MKYFMQAALFSVFFAVALSQTCQSGFVPNGSGGCNNVTGNCALPSAASLSTTSVAEFVSSSTISSNTISFELISNGTLQRVFNTINIGGNVGDNVNCQYPTSTNIVKGFNSSTCLDTFSISISIIDYVTCSSLPSTNDSTSITFPSFVSVQVTDQLASIRGANISRTTIASLGIEVTLPTTLSVNVTNLEVASSINFLAAITEQIYAYGQNNATIVLTTSVQYPYTLTVSNFNSGPSFEVQATAPTPCIGISNSSCTQTVSISINFGTACNFDGIYNFTFNYACQSGFSPCPVLDNQIVNVSLSLTSGNTCAELSVVTSISGTLVSYSDSGFTTPAIFFIANQIAYFQATILTEVEIQSITLTSLTANSISLFNSIAGVTPQGTQAGYDGVYASPNNYNFNFALTVGSEDLDIFNNGANADEVFTFDVVAEFSITYVTTLSRKRNIQTSVVSVSQKAAIDLSKSKKDAKVVPVVDSASIVGPSVLFAAGIAVLNNL